MPPRWHKRLGHRNTIDRMEDLLPTDGTARSMRDMRDPEVTAQRKTMINQPHIAPLAAFAARLRERGSVEVPDFDPLDGGIDARILFLLEKPGPMTAVKGKRVGSGFISRDNDDPTAAAIFEFMNQAGIPRKMSIIWNVIPWWNGTRKIGTPELKEGVDRVVELISLLPKLRAVVIVGAKAAAAKPFLSSTEAKLFSSDHPGPMVRARWPHRWKAIPVEWAKVRKFTEVVDIEPAPSDGNEPRTSDGPRNLHQSD